MPRLVSTSFCKSRKARKTLASLVVAAAVSAARHGMIRSRTAGWSNDSPAAMIGDLAER
jgi:hypothetical protein